MKTATRETYPTATAPFKEITTADEFIKWSSIVNESTGRAHLCDLQDIYARSNQETIKKLFMASPGNRRLYTFAIYKAMGDDAVYDFLRHYATTKAREIINTEMETLNREHINRAAELSRKEQAYNEARRAIYRKIRQLEERADRAKRHRTRSEENAEQWRERFKFAQETADANHNDAAKYRQIKNLLA